MSEPLRLTVRLVMFQRAVAMQVLDQDKRWLAGDSLEFRVAEDFYVRSMQGPDLTVHGVYLRGRDPGDDLRVSLHHFDDNAERDAYIHRLREALCEWSVKAMRSEPEPAVKILITEAE